MLPRSSLRSLRTAFVGFALLLAACGNRPTSQRPSDTAASSPAPTTTRVALATTTAPTLPQTATALPTPLPPTTVPTLAPTTVPTAAPAPTLPLSPPSDQHADLPAATVVRVIDGDTVDVQLAGAEVRVRLIGIDTPEIVDPRKPVQCFAREASDKAHELLDGQVVTMVADPSQDDTDRYGRLLRYLWLPDGHMFNQEMVAQGYAFEYTYRVPYKYQDAFKQAQHDARAQQLGLWSPATCNGEQRPADGAPAPPPPPPAPALPAAPVAPPEPAPAPPVAPPEPTAASLPAGNCDPSYPDVCIPPPPPDLDCGEIPYRNFRVLPPDPHRFDRDKDGVGCEQ